MNTFLGNMKKLSLMVCILGLLFSASAFSQRHPNRDRARHPATVQHLPSGKVGIRHGGQTFYSWHGVYYRHYPHGYVVVRPPFGLRVRALPFGYVTFHFGAVPYYYYYGTYYRYDPAARVYVVVEKPAEEKKDLPTGSFDRVVLVDGNTLEGVYLKGDKTTVQFEVDGKIREIPVDKIVSIQFAPSDSSTVDEGESPQ